MTLSIGTESLILIPCCAAKVSGGRPFQDLGDPFESAVPPQVYAAACNTRRRAFDAVSNDPSLLQGNFSKNRSLHDGPDFGGVLGGGRYLAAIERYTGTLYSVPGVRAAMRDNVGRGGAPHLMILSALYGPLHPLSPIQDYNLRMDQAPARLWQRAFLPVLESYVRTHAIRSIVMLVGTSTAYFRVASAAASELLRQGVLTDAVQYHVVEGGTRITPLEHGRVLHGLLTGRAYESPNIQQRWLSKKNVDAASGGQIGADPERDLNFTGMDTASATAEVKKQAHAMRRAPRPDASKDEIARMSAEFKVTSPLVSFADRKITMIEIQREALPAAAATVSIPRTANLNVPSDLAAHCDRFNDLLRRLHGGVHQGLALSNLIQAGRLADRGVYFFMDVQDPLDASTWRVCRIGTHAVSTGSKSTLRARLKTHLGSRNGNGNHRGSIFRLHVGNALLRRAGTGLSTWGVGSVAPSALRESDSLRLAELLHEHRVSDYIGGLHVLWVAVPDDPSPESERSTIERNAIAMLSRQARLAAFAPENWLGHESHRAEIRSSFLWNINYVNDDYDPGFLDVLERAVERTLVEYSRNS